MSNRLGLRQLRAYHAVMMCGSVSAAADRLNLTQPAISKQLSALEHALGIRLFQRRSGSAMTPTREGLEFFRAAEATISGVEDLQAIAREIAERGRRRIRVAATPPLLNSAHLMLALQRFKDAQPNVHIALEARSRLDIEDWLINRQIDFALALLPASNPALKTESLAEARVIAAMAPAHPLAMEKELTPDLIDGHTLILPSRQPMRTIIDGVLQRSGHDLSADLEVSSSLTCCRLAASGLGVALCDPFGPTAFEDRSLAIRRWAPEVILTYGLLMPRDVSVDDETAILLAEIREAFGDTSTDDPYQRHSKA